MDRTQPKDWQATLTEVEQAIQGCLENLTRFESQFQQILAKTEEPTTRNTTHLNWEAADTLPDALFSAERHVDELQQYLQDQQQVWWQWQESLVNWKLSVEQAEPAAPVPGSDSEEQS